MKTFNILLLILLTAELFCWSGISAQAPIQKSTTTVVPSQGKAAGNEIIAPSNITNTASKKKKKGTKPKPKPTLGGTGMADGSVQFKLPTDGTSNTPNSSTNTESNKKKKSKPTFGGINDGTSNTMMKSESKPKDKGPKGIKGTTDGTSNTIHSSEKPTNKRSYGSAGAKSTIKNQPSKAVNKKD